MKICAKNGCGKSPDVFVRVRQSWGGSSFTDLHGNIPDQGPTNVFCPQCAPSFEEEPFAEFSPDGVKELPPQERGLLSLFVRHEQPMSFRDLTLGMAVSDERALMISLKKKGFLEHDSAMCWLTARGNQLIGEWRTLVGA